MTHRLSRPAALLAVVLLATAGCAAPVARTTPAPAAPAGAPHYRRFPSADSLAGYLRAGSAAGPLLSAHRGGPVGRYPENALATFEHTVAYAPALLEIDVRHTRDGALVLLHDETLDRTTTGAGPLAARTLSEVRALRLEDADGRPTPHGVPTLAEALAWAEARAVLLLDVKQGVAPERLVEAVRDAGAENRVVVIVYTHHELLRYHRLAPELTISFSPATPADVERALAAGVPARRLIAFTGVGAVKPELIAALRRHGIRSQLATFGALDARASAEGAAVYRRLLAEGVDVISTDSVVNAARAVERD